MVKRFKKFDPQLVVVEQNSSAIVLTNEQKLSIYKKSQKSGISTDILEEVYCRGYKIWNESFNQTPEQFAFDRVNSFIAGGFAADLDDDLLNELSRETLVSYRQKAGKANKSVYNKLQYEYDKPKEDRNKQKINDLSREKENKSLGLNTALKKINRIDRNSNQNIEEKKMMDNPCWKGYKAYGTKKKNGRTVPNCVPANEEYTGSDPKSSDPNNPLARMDGTYSGASVYAKKTPGQKLDHTPKSTLKVNTLKVIKKVVKEDLDEKSKNSLNSFEKFVKDLKDKDNEIKVNASVAKAEDRTADPHPATQLPTTFADRKAKADKETPTGVKKPNINTDIQRNINTRLAPVLGGLKQKMDGKFRQNSISRMSEENINEITTPLGTTGKRASTHMKTGPVRNAAGKIVTTNVYKSGSSRGGGGSGSAGGSGGGGSSGDV